jgi:hypothetical protein
MLKFAFALTFFSSVTFAGTLPVDYETWSGPAKRDFLWNERILPKQYRYFNPTHIGTACKVALNAPVSMLSLFQSFNHPSDEVPKIFIFNRRKVLHPIGVVAKVRFHNTSGAFTGLLRREGCCRAGPPIARSPAFAWSAIFPRYRAQTLRWMANRR